MTTEQAKQRKAERRRAARAQRRATRQQVTRAPRPRAPHARAVNDAFSVYTSQGAALARQMALPGEYSEFARVPTVDMPSTAVLRSVDTTVLLLNAPTTVALYGQGGRMAAVSPLVYSYSAVGIVITKASFMDRKGNKVLAQPLIPEASAGSITYEGTEWFRPTSFAPETKPTNTEQITTTRPIGLSSGRSFIWVDKGERVSFKIMITPSSDASLTFVNPLRVTFYRWVGPHEPHRLTHTTEFTLEADVDLPESGYYTWSYTFAEAVAVTGQPSIRVELKNISTAISRTAFLASATLGSASVGDTVRRTAASLLLSNTTAELHKGGSIIAARILADDDGIGDLSIDPGTKADKYVGPGAKGLYTYMDFDSDAEAFSQAYNTMAYPTCLLDINSYVHVIRLNPAAEYTDQTYQITVTGLFEFRSDSMLFQRAVPTLSHDALVEARRVNNATMYFYENPLHMSDVWRYIKTAFNGMRRIAMPIGTAISTLNPELAPIAMPLAHALQI